MTTRLITVSDAIPATDCSFCSTANDRLKRGTTPECYQLRLLACLLIFAIEDFVYAKYSLMSHAVFELHVPALLAALRATELQSTVARSPHLAQNDRAWSWRTLTRTDTLRPRSAPHSPAAVWLRRPASAPPRRLAPEPRARIPPRPFSPYMTAAEARTVQALALLEALERRFVKSAGPDGRAHPAVAMSLIRQLLRPAAGDHCVTDDPCADEAGRRIPGNRAGLNKSGGSGTCSSEFVNVPPDPMCGS